MGRLEEAITAFEQAIALDPLGSDTAAIQAETLSFMKDWNRLEPLLDKWLPMHPDSFDLLFWKYRLLIDGYGDLDRARALLADARMVSGSRLLMAFEEQALYERDWERALAVARATENQGFMAILDMTEDYRVGRVYALMGQAETASDYLGRYLENARQEQKNGPVAQALQAANMAEAHALLGEPERAIHYARLADTTIGEIDDLFWTRLVDQTTTQVLAKAGLRDEALARIEVRIHEPGHRGQWSMYLDPAWDFFHDDPRFVELVRPAGVEPEPFREQGRKP
jgi:tetratricopeptide (TPR) repeat protein